MSKSCFIAVTNRSLCKRPFFDVMEDLSKKDIKTIVLREKDLKEEDYYEIPKKCQEICENHSASLTIHNFVNVARKLGIKKIHLSYPVFLKEAGNLTDFESVSTSIHKPEEALKAVSRFSRDKARTPMQSTDAENAGFTTGKPWLKVNANYTKINAESQMNDPESVRSFYKKLIALRKNPEYKETVVYGELEPVWEDVNNLMAYYRKGDKNLLVVGNYQKEPQTIELAGECRKVLINNYDKVAMDGNKIELQGYQFLVIEM